MVEIKNGAAAGREVPDGKVLPGSPDELRELANAALAEGQVQKAARFYTMAIDLLAKDMPRDKDGFASDAALLKLNETSSGLIAKLLSNRSMAHLKLGDEEAAIEDAETCTRAEPSFEKGHLRLAVAMEAARVPLQRQLEACERAVEACPGSQPLIARKWRLKRAAAAQPQADSQASGAEDSEQSRLKETQCLADDASDPRRAAAAADLGGILAAGAYGLAKDVKRAEHYLTIGSEGGEVQAQFNLGMLLLELGRPAEAAEELSKATAAGDERAERVLQQLCSEAKDQEAEARAKLEEMAREGDERAMAMLRELGR